ncbi:MAG: putative sulfate/molybdate transporter [Rhodobacterales bacterium]|nr:putative sulfate/molybdate transporter [Rhodobacterales bacterium]
MARSSLYISERLRSLSGELSGALGDLGTFLPYVIAITGAGVLAPTPVFLGFAAGYALVALVYKAPIAVQPMKAVGALVIAGSLTAPEIAWTGATIGAFLLMFSASARLDKVARAIPQSVVTGLQVGLGLMLGMVAVGLMAAQWVLAIPALAVLALSLIWGRGPWAVIVVGASALLAPASDPVLVIAAPYADVSIRAVLSGIAAQLPLTLLNAVVVAAAVTRSLYPSRASLVSQRRLAATSGALNLLLVPFGALPMCHGAGGIAAHHRFGARGIGAPLTMAALCVAAALTGQDVMRWLTMIPMPVVGALLAYAAADLVLSRRMFDARADCRPVIGVAAIMTVALGAGAGLVAGLAAEAVRVQLRRRRQIIDTQR